MGTYIGYIISYIASKAVPSFAHICQRNKHWGGGVGSKDPSTFLFTRIVNFYWPPPILDMWICSSQVFFQCFHWKKSGLFQDYIGYTRLNDLSTYLNSNKFRGKTHRVHSPDPSPALSRSSPSIRASNVGRFALSIRPGLSDSDLPTLLTRCCALAREGIAARKYTKGLQLHLAIIYMIFIHTALVGY